MLCVHAVCAAYSFWKGMDKQRLCTAEYLYRLNKSWDEVETYDRDTF